jgi:ribonuclease BN (tRNA processing enzyme)
MKITFVGVGGAFAGADQFQSNLLITSDSGKKLMVDCGNLAPLAYRELGITNANVGGEIDGIFITHQHADHIGGLEWLLFCTFFNPTLKGKKPKLFTTNSLMRKLWNTSLKGGLESIEGRLMTLDDYFDCQPVRKNSVFVWEGIEFRPVQTVHVMNGFKIVESYGLMITPPSGKKVYFTGDTQFCPHQIEAFYKQADVIFHDCETYPFHSKVHAHYDFLKTLKPEFKGKMHLYHYGPDPKQPAIEDGFLGFVKKGQTFTF